MKVWLWRAIGAVILIAVAAWLWSVFFPGPERVIRKRLAELASAISIRGQESPLAVVANASKVGDFFTKDIEIRVDVPGASTQVINGKDELLEIAKGVRFTRGGLEVQFLDINLNIASDKKSAEANLTLRAKTATDRDQFVQEIKLLLNKSEGNWRIQRVETVKTLSRVLM